MSAFKEEQLKRGDTQFVHNSETDALAGRVREIAHRALNMSYLELDEFFEDQSTSQVVCLDEMAHIVASVVCVYLLNNVRYTSSLLLVK